MDLGALLRTALLRTALSSGNAGLQLRMVPQPRGANDADEDSMDTDDTMPPLTLAPIPDRFDPVLKGVSGLARRMEYTVEVQDSQLIQQMSKHKWHYMGNTEPLASFHDAYERVLENFICVQHVLVAHARSDLAAQNSAFQSILEFRDSPGSGLSNLATNPSAVCAAYIAREMAQPNNDIHLMFKVAWGGFLPQWVGCVIDKCETLIDLLALSKKSGSDILVFKFRSQNRHLLDMFKWKMFYMAVIENILGNHADRTFMQWIISPESPMSMNEIAQFFGAASDEAASMMDNSVFHRTAGQFEEREAPPKRQATPIASFEDTTIEATLKTYSKIDSPTVSFDQIAQFTQWLSKQSTKLLPASLLVWGNARLQSLQACNTFESLKQDLLGAPFSWSATNVLFANRHTLRRFFKMLQSAWFMTLRRLMGNAKKR